MQKEILICPDDIQGTDYAHCYQPGILQVFFTFRKLKIGQTFTRDRPDVMWGCLLRNTASRTDTAYHRSDRSKPRSGAY